MMTFDKLRLGGARIAVLLAVCFGATVVEVHGADTNALRFINPEVQLGALTNGQDVPLTFVLTNASDQAVKISGVETSCHCTSVEKYPDVIAAHGSGAVEINFNTSRSDGPVAQTVLVETADGTTIAAEFQASVAARLEPAAPWIPDRGDGTYQNPVLFADYSDPDVVRVGDDY